MPNLQVVAEARNGWVKHPIVDRFRDVFRSEDASGPTIFNLPRHVERVETGEVGATVRRHIPDTVPIYVLDEPRRLLAADKAEVLELLEDEDQWDGVFWWFFDSSLTWAVALDENSHEFNRATLFRLRG
jgi:hypothetical protein